MLAEALEPRDLALDDLGLPPGEADLVDFCLDTTHNPEEFIDCAFPWGEPGILEREHFKDWQRNIAQIIGGHLSNPDTVHEPCMIAVASGHGPGKSALISMISNWAMSTCVDTRILVTANTDGQLRTKTSPEVQKWFAMSATAHWFNGTTTRVAAVHPDSAIRWRLDFTPWSSHNTDAFQGLHNKRNRIVVIMDEASNIDDGVWEVVEGAMTDEFTEIIWIAFGNPTRATGRFRECFRKHGKYWHHIHVDSRDVPGTNKKLFARWAEQYGVDSDFFKVRVRGMFPNLSVKGLFPADLVDAASGRHLEPGQFNFAPVCISCDPAWEGDDELVIAARQGLRFKVLKRMPKNNDDVGVATQIAMYEDRYRATMVNVDLGYGTGIVSAGESMGRSWNLVAFSGASPDPGCVNMRAYMHVQILDWLQSGGSFDAQEEELYDEMLACELVSRTDGKKLLLPKEDMKVLLGHSPNTLDCLGLTLAYPVPALNDQEHSRQALGDTPGRRDNPIARRLQH
jgi:hypothetical protein